jgi:ribosome-associated protein
MSSTADAKARRPLRQDRIARIEPRELALAAARETLKKKAEDVVLLDLKTLSAVCDYFVIASGRSETQVKAIADQVREGLEEQGHHVWHIEGLAALKWVLLDYVDVVVHVFHHETRAVYQLERLWADAGKESCADD